MVDGGEVLPDALASTGVVTMNDHHFRSFVVFIGKGIMPWVTRGLLPSHHWSKGIADFSAVRCRRVVPAVVAAVAFVDGKVIPPAGRTHVLAFLWTWFQLVHEVQN